MLTGYDLWIAAHYARGNWHRLISHHKIQGDDGKVRLYLNVCGNCNAASYESMFLVAVLRNQIDGSEKEICAKCYGRVLKRFGKFKLPVVAQEERGQW
jgi:hypothetical protein